MIDFQKKYEEYLNYFNLELEKYICSLRPTNEHILQCMKYSLFSGGKRVRPVLGLAANEILGGNKDRILPFVIAIELIHTYSLIHDDLPCMDNDEFRRGKPTNHKVYGEGYALLAGDALLNLAYELIFNSIDTSVSDIKVGKIISNFAGIFGMVGGQASDISSEVITPSVLDYIIENKTGKLITAPLLVASILNDEKYYSELSQYGYNLGYLFQLTDDLLDKNKLENNSVKLYGEEKVNELCLKYLDNCVKAVKDIPNSEFLIEFAKKILTRNN